jgi:hypothetical protein
MVLQIPVGGVVGLPDAVHVGFAIPRVTRGAAGTASRGGLSASRRRLSRRSASGRGGPAARRRLPRHARDTQGEDGSDGGRCDRCGYQASEPNSH